MAIIKCPECGASVSSLAQKCPNCGYPIADSTRQPSEPNMSSSNYNQTIGNDYSETHQYNVGVATPTMGFSEAIHKCMKEKYASFEGRASRAEYWWYSFFVFLITLATTLVFTILGVIVDSNDSLAMIGTIHVGLIICGLVFLCPSISVCVRRLHDTDKSGWWYWISVIPYVGSIVLFVFMLLPGTTGTNKYGYKP